ncbi:hypothetical protein F5879DRAFT_810800 [Lentinula edodes]|nr:hypothetical protein HHX47_DHR7000017 [Lentinula edodes]KAJ3899491.1 hypothetical protein F5879DRAFT_810800 [Lentinula edodes]KAJ3921774.1 hypothetical protein F5877DRAFT_35289 [Lentinula edodes]
MSTNPSHILIARNSNNYYSVSRGPNNPSASLSSPTETHVHAAASASGAGISPYLLSESEPEEGAEETDGGEEDIEIHETFTKNAKFPGTVKIIVENTTFWTHKEVLVFASPFFEAALSGNWSETETEGKEGTDEEHSQRLSGRPPSIITISHSIGPDSETEMRVTFDPVKENDIDIDRSRSDTLTKLQDSSPPPTAVIVLQEERPSTFHDFLQYIYPHLSCIITWNNVEPLIHISHKLLQPSLQRDCLTFLLTHAAGKPIKAMRIAELFEEEELYKESSRFVLDNPGGWSEDEMCSLTQETLLKLEKRRNWFLERVLKIGLTSVAKEYQCCSSCPDPPLCARQLEEKWRQAYHAVFRFGPPQPSMVYRYLRQLEGVSPPLSLTHLACQTTAKAFIATLFDRMFSLGVPRTSSSLNPTNVEVAQHAPLSLGTRVAAAAIAAGGSTAPRRHFLFCTLRPEGTRQRGAKGKRRERERSSRVGDT